MKIKQKWTRISLIVAAMAGLSTLTFNCAPSLFEKADSAGAASSSSTGGTESPIDPFNAPKTSPYVLMTARQTYQTFLSVTGQSGAATAAQLTEFDARANSMATNERLSNVNAPLQMAATSLAGEVCNGLLTREAAAAAASRKFFAQVDFTRPAAQNSQAAFEASVAVMASSFWNRQPSADEKLALMNFYTDFSASAGTAAAGTRNLYLAACTGMLAALDTYSF